FDASEIGVENGISVDAKGAVLEGASEVEGHDFLNGGTEGDGFNLPAELVFCFLGKLNAEAGGVDAAALKIGKLEDGIESFFDLGESFVEQFDADPVPHDI